MSGDREPSPGRHRAGHRRAAKRSQPRWAWVVGVVGAVVVLETTGLGVVNRPAANQTAPFDSSTVPPLPASEPPGDVSVSDSPREALETPLRRRATAPAKPVSPTRVPESGSGLFDVASTLTPATDDLATAVTYQVEVELDLDFRPDSIARTVDATLADPRGWSSGGAHRLSRVSGSGDLRVVIATPQTADALCAPLETRGRLSCRNGRDVVINAWRWANGGPGYRGNIEDYRRYVVNHEVGHALGFAHVECPAPGRPSPVMLQQTLGLDGCLPNPWPARVDLAG